MRVNASANSGPDSRIVGFLAYVFRLLLPDSATTIHLSGFSLHLDLIINEALEEVTMPCSAVPPSLSLSRSLSLSPSPLLSFSLSLSLSLSLSVSLSLSLSDSLSLARSLSLALSLSRSLSVSLSLSLSFSQFD